MVNKIFNTGGLRGGYRCAANGNFVGVHIGANVVNGANTVNGLSKCSIVADVAHNGFFGSQCFDKRNVFISIYKRADIGFPFRQRPDDGLSCFACGTCD
jgi:hypothetical protein